MNIDCFIVDSSSLQPHLHLTSVAFCILSVIPRQ